MLDERLHTAVAEMATLFLVLPVLKRGFEFKVVRCDQFKTDIFGDSLSVITDLTYVDTLLFLNLQKRPGIFLNTVMWR